MADVVEKGSGRGLSRRDMIKASAVAGAAAWTAPMIVDSLTSPAAAASNPHNYACSKGYVFYKIAGDSNVYYTGFKTGTPACNQCGANGAEPDLLFNTSTCATGGDVGCFWKGDVSGTCASNTTLLKWSTTVCAANGAGMNNTVFDSNCSAHVSLDAATGRIVTAAANVEILAAIAFTASNWFGVCRNAAGNGNSVSMPITCNDP
jgi:hypothetical protein